MKFAITAVAMLGATMAATSASAATITFDEYAGAQQTYSSLVSGGFLFTNSSSSAEALLIWAQGSSNNADPIGATLSNNYGNTTTTVAKVDGTTFLLGSIDMTNVYNLDTTGQGYANAVQFDFSDGTSQTVHLSDLQGLKTFAFNKAGLSSFSYTPVSTYGGWIQVDNIVVDALGAGAVPENGTWAMLISGVGMVGAAMRRRRKASVSVSYAA